MGRREGAIGWTGKRIMYCNYLCVRLLQSLATRFHSPVLQLQCYKQAEQKGAEHVIRHKVREVSGKFSEISFSVLFRYLPLTHSSVCPFPTLTVGRGTAVGK